eukprot:5046023-Pleurochrysis_carterae.AAC.1
MSRAGGGIEAARTAPAASRATRHRPAPAARKGENGDGQTDGPGDGTGGARAQGAERGRGE